MAKRKTLALQIVVFHRLAQAIYRKASDTLIFPPLAFDRRILVGNCYFAGASIAGAAATSTTSEEADGSCGMHLSTEFASENDLLDRVMEKGIVVEVWDRVELTGIDMTGMRVSISSIRLFEEGRNPPFRTGYFWKVEPS
jgi:hypothetical protein